MIYVGADPEFFVVDQDRRVIPGAAFTSGTKEKPEDIGDGIAIHQDNITLELNFPPKKQKHEFIEQVQYSLNEMRKRIYPNRLEMSPSLVFTKEELILFGPTAMEFRCDPEENIWGDPTYPNMNPLLRSAGGHVHIGWSDQVELEDQTRVAMWADLLIGVPGVLFEDHRKAAARRVNYGKPGSLRRKPYGLEYRTPGNEWFKTTEAIGCMFDLVHNCVKRALDDGEVPPWRTQKEVDRLWSCIRNSDHHEALALIDQYKG
jgi:hypothetical protein